MHTGGLKNISVEDLEDPLLAGGHVKEVVDAMIAADKANIGLDWRRAMLSILPDGISRSDQDV